MSHGETSSVAKLAFESTTLPLLTVGCWMSAGLGGLGLDCLGLMRDAAEEVVSGAASATEPNSMSDSEDSRRLFAGVSFSMASYDEEVSLPESKEVDFRRTGCGMAAGGET